MKEEEALTKPLFNCLNKYNLFFTIIANNTAISVSVVTKIYSFNPTVFSHVEI